MYVYVYVCVCTRVCSWYYSSPLAFIVAFALESIHTEPVDVHRDTATQSLELECDRLRIVLLRNDLPRLVVAACICAAGMGRTTA